MQFLQFSAILVQREFFAASVALRWKGGIGDAKRTHFAACLGMARLGNAKSVFALQVAFFVEPSCKSVLVASMTLCYLPQGWHRGCCDSISIVSPWVLAPGQQKTWPSQRRFLPSSVLCASGLLSSSSPFPLPVTIVQQAEFRLSNIITTATLLH